MVCNDGLNQDMTGNKDDFEELHNDDETEIVQHNTDWRWQHLPRGSVRVYAGVLYLLSPYPIVVIYCHFLWSPTPQQITPGQFYWILSNIWKWELDINTTTGNT